MNDDRLTALPGTEPKTSSLAASRRAAPYPPANKEFYFFSPSQLFSLEILIIVMMDKVSADWLVDERKEVRKKRERDRFVIISLGVLPGGGVFIKKKR